MMSVIMKRLNCDIVFLKIHKIFSHIIQLFNLNIIKLSLFGSHSTGIILTKADVEEWFYTSMQLLSSDVIIIYFDKNSNVLISSIVPCTVFTLHLKKRVYVSGDI